MQAVVVVFPFYMFKSLLHIIYRVLSFAPFQQQTLRIAKFLYFKIIIYQDITESYVKTSLSEGKGKTLAEAQKR